MKLGKVGALCKGAKRFIIYNVPGGQWISDGNAIYPLVDLPRFDEDNVYTLFDIPEDKRGKVQYEEKTGLPWGVSISDSVPDEVEVRHALIGISYCGALYSPVGGRGGILFIDRRYLAPFSDDITIYERFYPGSDRSYLAVKRGMLLEGIILPSDIATQELAQTLITVGKLTADAAGWEETEAEAEQEEMDI